VSEDVEVKGLSELKRALSDLPVKVERNISRGALRAGGVVYRDEIVATAPRDTGAMAGRVDVQAGAKKNGRVYAHVAVRDPKAHLVEYGTRPHDIKPRSSPSLFFAGIFRKLIRHPGTKAQPFVRPAFDSKTPGAIQAIAAYIGARIAKEAKAK
jgi:HK97 gp10 family phage protein